LKIADVQILFYAIDSTSIHHRIAGRWLEDAINAKEGLGLTWSTIHQFLRLGTRPSYPGCMQDAEALAWIDGWLEAGLEIVPDSEASWALFNELIEDSSRTLRKTIDDAHLAAVAISRGATLASFDSDFSGFTNRGLRLEHLSLDH
jgi:toxin-antitoxin system PIN domain toxin